MSEPDSSTSGRNGVKTLGIRFQPEVHAQLSLIAQLRGHSFQDEVIAAVEAHIAESRNDEALLARVEEAQAEIARRAQESQATLTSLFAISGPATTGDQPPSSSGTSRPERARSRRAGGEDSTT
jgi:hypothetical protein